MNADRSGERGGTTLHTQLMRVIVMIFALALSGLFAGHWKSTKTYVERQLASHAQDAASSLALALSSALKDGDMVLAETTVMPLFDRGFYRSVIVRDVDGTVLFEQHLQATDLRGVPGWFRVLADLHPSMQQAVVSAGWRQIGRVEVVSEPHFAYGQLWRSSLEMTGWMLVVFVVAWFIARIWLRSVLVPLDELENAAQNIVERRFCKITVQPQAVELKRVVAGFNRLIDAVQSLLGNEEQRAERFRKEALSDPMTGMLNRSGLAHHVGEGVPDHAWLGIIECADIGTVNSNYGYEAGNELIRMMAQTIWDSFSDAVTIRLSAAGFAVLIHEPVSADQIQVRCLAFNETVTGVCEKILTPLRISSGWACRQQRDLSEWLAAADFLLSQARQHSDEVCAVERASLQAPDISARRVVDWTNRISQSLAMKRVRLYSQATLSIDAAGNRQEMHSELLAVLLDENTTEQAASQWLEIAAKQGLLAELDGIVLEIMASYSGDRRGAMVVNLSCQSWQDQAFVDALPRLRKCLGQFDRVLFELREEDVVPLLKTAVKFVQTAKQAGFGVAIDRFGVAAGGIACLRELLPEYVKLDVSLVKNIDTDAGRFHLESLVTIARTLDIQVLALSFDQDDILEELQRLGISGVQGYAFASKKLFADCL